MVYGLTVKGKFDAAHYILGHQGKCQNIHGHTWKVSATFYYCCVNELGMCCDFAELKSQLNQVLDQLDHNFLNSTELFNTSNALLHNNFIKSINPTAENIAKYIFEQIHKINENIMSVEVWETDDQSVIYSPKGEPRYENK